MRPALFRLPPKLQRHARRSRMTLLLILLGVTLLILAPLLYGIYKPPRAVVNYFARQYPDVLFHIPTNQKVVALTIDDAPSSETAEILRILKANDATATFFVIGGQAEGREDILESIIGVGNELANHAMHDEPSMNLLDEELADQIKETQSKLMDAYGGVGIAKGPTKFFRPGSGVFNKRMRENVKKLGYQMVLGDIYPHDPLVPYWKVNQKHVMSMLKPGGIIILHDRRSWTPPLLKSLLPEIKKEGYRIVSLSEALRLAEKENGGPVLKSD